MTDADRKDIARAIAALDKMAERLGSTWDDYEYDQVSRARAELVEALGKTP